MTGSTAIAAWVLLGSAHAATIEVPDDFPTIGDALAAASSGDTIEIAAGEYAEALEVEVDLTLVGVDGAAVTVLTASTDRPVIEVTEGAVVAVSNLTLTSGTKRAVEVRKASAVTLSDVSLIDTVVTQSGGGMYISDASTVLVERSTLDGNASNNKGGHIEIKKDSVLTAIDTRFANGAAKEGGAIRADDATVALIGCTFEDNRAEQEGGSLFAESSEIVLEDVAFTDGHATSGGHVYLSGGSLTATRTAFRWADAVELGGSVLVDDCDGSSTQSATCEQVGVVVEQCTFEGNTAGEKGGAIALLERDAALAVTNTELVHNTAAAGGALYVDAADSVEMQANLLCGNAAEDGHGGGARISGVRGAHRWANNLFVENAAQGDGGAVHMSGYTASVINNSFLSNAAEDQGGAIRAVDVTLSYVNNLAAWTPAGAGLDVTGQLDLAYNAWFDNPTDARAESGALEPGVGAVLGDPQLDGYTADGNCTNDAYALGANSPLVDAGDPALVDADGTRSDIGAFGGAQDAFTDRDRDGHFDIVDCDDADPAVHPGAVEVCDEHELDEDCDGVANESGAQGASVWYPDTDRDGYGDRDRATEALCTGPEGFTRVDGDCDDFDAAIHPDAADIPDDGVDQNCSGTDAVEWYGNGACGCGTPSEGGGATLALVAALACLRRRPASPPQLAKV